MRTIAIVVWQAEAAAIEAATWSVQSRWNWLQHSADPEGMMRCGTMQHGSWKRQSSGTKPR